MNSSKESEKRRPNPILNANFLSKWFFFWTRETFRKGRREELETKDLYMNIPDLDSENLSISLVQYWEREERRKKPSLLHMIFCAFGWRFVPLSILYSILEISIHVTQPLCIGGLVSYFTVDQTDINKNQAYLYAMGIVLCSLVNTLCFHPFMFFLFETGTRIRLACAGLIYTKSLRTSITAENNGLNGLAISLLSTDLPQFDLTFYFFYDLWKGPIEACIFGYVMYREIGWSALIGIAFIIAFIPLQGWAAKAAVYYRTKSAAYGDKRKKFMNEIITAIQVIKMYAWEKCFAKLIAAVRKKEVENIRGSMNIYAALQCTNMISAFALFVSLVIYVYTGDTITAQKVFIVSSYYSMLNDSLLHFWPLAITTWAETLVCSRRITAFLLKSEVPTQKEEEEAMGGIVNLGMDEKQQYAKARRRHNTWASKKEIDLRNLSASWSKKTSTADKTRLHIRDINVQIREKQFVGIVGNIGSGKSTLLNALIGELTIIEGEAIINGSLSYAPQEPWIFQSSIRENIIFVEPYDEVRYKAVLHACQLERDIELFPYGDTTIVGERGISLSGGQKARISLARAVYRQADIYILDDPLSAVDSYVGKMLLEKCLLKFLSDKIRILVTHHVQHLKSTDHLIIMEDGKASVQGRFEELQDFLHFHVRPDDEDVKNKLRHSESIIDKDREIEVEFKVNTDTGDERREQQLQGSVQFFTYLTYFRALGLPWVIFVIFALFLLARGCLAAMNIFISNWATWEESLAVNPEPSEEYEGQRQRMIILYTILIFCTLLLYLMRTFGFFLMCLRISLRLHDQLFNGIIRAYMYFFNNNPSGRVLNRFSSDISNIDVALPQAMLDSYTFFVDAIAILVIVAIANYWLVIAAAVMIALLYYIRSLYIGASRSLKRIEAMTRSPIYSHTNQSFQGLTTIRALNATQQMNNEFHDHQNTNTSALYLYTSTNRAFALWTDLVCVLYIFAVTFSFLWIDEHFASGDVGLAITQSMTLVITCQWGMRQTAVLENNMTSVERVMEYAKTPSEPPLETDTKLKLPLEWPNQGSLQFSDFKLRYSAQGDYILKGLNFSIRPMEKLGIVGRTGAGKSSIIQAVFRLAYNEGLIDIDGHDIEKLGLHDLRSRLSIIPQDPVLFSGTLRFNLDPFELRGYEEMWKALEDVKLKTYVGSLDGGLNAEVQDGGVNFSMGQRQLVCMARALLRKNRILIMDEATANVDPETDELIQETIKSKFEQCTVITIAHRLHTVMGNDRVLVMDAGNVVEFGHPHELLQNKEGHLTRFVNQTGRTTANDLRRIAQNSYKRKSFSEIYQEREL